MGHRSRTPALLSGEVLAKNALDALAGWHGRRAAARAQNMYVVSSRAVAKSAIRSNLPRIERPWHKRQCETLNQLQLRSERDAADDDQQRGKRAYHHAKASPYDVLAARVIREILPRLHLQPNIAI